MRIMTWRLTGSEEDRRKRILNDRVRMKTWRRKRKYWLYNEKKGKINREENEMEDEEKVERGETKNLL